MAKILAVDDSSSMLHMVSFILTEGGHEVVNARDGVEALEVAKGNAVDLVLTDVNMPYMDGITLVKELRALSSYKSIPMLMLTTESSPQKKMEGKAAGATGWMVKPVEPDRLLATVNKVLG